MSNDIVLYSAYNARFMSVKNVAATFVDNEYYRVLIHPEHSLLLGPRGSGKTTLLRMMTPAALHSWPEDAYAGEKPSLDFTAVYIPSDIHWADQMKYVQRRLEAHPQFEHAVSEAAVTTNVLTSICSTLSQRLQYEFAEQDRDNLEQSMCRELIGKWYLPPMIPSFNAVHLALNRRVSEINQKVKAVLRSQRPEDILDCLPGYFDLDYMAEAVYAGELFDSVCSVGEPSKWALCFDELEIAPEWLQERVISEMRSSDQRILLKLGTCPIPKLQASAHAPQEGDDFRAIHLWHADTVGSRKFCEDLTKSVLKQHFSREVTPQSIFGTSVFARDDTGYDKESGAWVIINEAAQSDSSLRKLLLDKGVVMPDGSLCSDQKKRDEVLRKAKPLAIIRAYFLKTTEEGAVVKRSRKSRTMYSGVEALYHASDGNPRWLIGLVSDILQAAAQSNRDVKAIPTSVQAQCLHATSRHLLTKVQALPDETVTLGNSTKSLYEIICEIGTYFSNRILRGDFSLDPPGSFRVDDMVPPVLFPLLKTASDYGIIIEVNPEGHAISNVLVNRRFRLSYMLSPEFKLLFRLNHAVNLSSCISVPDGSALDESDQLSFRLEV